jgi:hypothetical protein
MARREQEEDFLEEDPEIPSQKIVLLSFLSPEKILADKSQFFFTEFLKDYNLQWRTSKFEAWLAGQVSSLNTKLESLAGKMEVPPDASGVVLTPAEAAKEIRGNLLRVDHLVEEYQEFVRKNQREINTSQMKEEYDTFIFKNEAKLEDEFFKKNDFHTTMRGVKVRGTYATEAEAQARAKRLQKSDPNFNIYMGAVGKWMAWEPDPNKVAGQEYANEQLNTLMKKYRENEESREQFYNEQKKQRMGNAKTKAADDVAPEVKLTATDDTPFSGAAAGSGNFDGLFSGPADLAIQRKMENKE